MKMRNSWSFLSKPPMTMVFLCLIALWEAGVAVFHPLASRASIALGHCGDFHLTTEPVPGERLDHPA